LRLFKSLPALASKVTLDNMGFKERRYFLLLGIGSILLFGACEKPNNPISTPSAMPNLIGLTFKEAQEALLRTPLEGKLTYEDLFDDRVVWKGSNWIVVSQEPNPADGFENAITPCVGIIKKEEASDFDDSRKQSCSKHTSTFENIQTTTTTTTTSVVSTTTAPFFSREEILKAVKQMRSEKDQVTNYNFLEDKSSPTNWADSFYLYIITKEGYEPSLRFYVSYYGSNWIFWSNLTLNIDGDIYEVNAKGVKHDNNSMVYEWLDVLPTDSQLLIIAMVANSRSTLVRLEGDSYKHDFEVGPTQKKALLNVLAVYDGFRRGILNSP